MDVAIGPSGQGRFTGADMIAFRYIHKINRAVERDMLRRSRHNRIDRRRKGLPADLLYDHDVESLQVSILMTPSYLRETKKIKEALSAT